MKPCQVEGCEKPAGVPGTARGWCSTHYSRWQKTGDPLVAPTDLKPAPSPTCAVDGCESPRWARGWCSTHYARWRKDGDPGTAERMTQPAAGRCHVAGCRRRVRTKGLCQRHYLRQRRYGDPLAGGSLFGVHTKCAARFCNREHYCRGLCRAHWAVVQRVTDDRGARLGREIPGTCSPAQLVARVDLYANHCWMCGAEATEIDHVKPLSAGGSNWPANLRPACHPCNRAKSNHWPLRSAA